MKFRILRHFFVVACMALAFSACRNEDNRIEPTCFDEVKNQGEEGIDCGGPCEECLPTCDDRKLNGLEQFIDCGGEDCEPCASCNDNIQNAHWRPDPNLTEADFASNDSVGLAGGIYWKLVMEQGVDCGVPCDTFCVATCDDGIQNGDETGIDCGGTNCILPCPPPSCFDGIQNGQETGIDCGAPGCPECPMPTCDDGIQNTHIEYVEVSCEFPLGYIVVVETGPDCDNDFTTSCPDCPIPTCFDGIQNGDETGIDCDEIPDNFCPPCDPVPSCGNGYQDGSETGVDCDDDPATLCPPCANCSDGIKNGPELEIDCVDWPIADYDNGTCEQCLSCHDGEWDLEENFELQMDCGGPNCPRCTEFLVAEIDGSDFQDQASFNLVFSSNPCINITPDTIFVPNSLTFSPTTGQFTGTPSRTLTGIQQVPTPNGTFERVLEIVMPRPNDIAAGPVFEVIEYALGIPEPPSIRYTEGFIDGPFAGMRTYNSLAPNDPAYTMMDDDREFQLQTKVEILPEGFAYLVGTINFAKIEQQFGLTEEIFEVRNVAFAIQYNYYE
ncbi:MAG: Ig domain-containing protein [Bacteroidota bacterium]